MTETTITNIQYHNSKKMAAYIQLRFDISNDNEIVGDILSANLVEIGFDSFSNDGTEYLAYIPKNLFDEKAVNDIIKELPIKADVSFTITEFEDKNWNEEWEKNYFQPIIIGDKCVIHSTFHKNIPKAKYDILIDPKMSFGTGHHETTSQMINHILNLDLKNKNVLDMGCGTSILGILASMCGAEKVTAIDIDEWCYNNSLENIALNHIKNIEVQCGDASLLSGRKFDVILANINRNILLNDIPTYVKSLNDGGELIVSGFYESDIPAISEMCFSCGLSFITNTEKNKWVAVKYKKMSSI